MARGPQPAAVASSDSNRLLWLVALALCALTLIVFLQTAHFDFINFDDDRYVSEHPIISKGLTLDGIKYAFTSYRYFYWHPVTWLSHMLDCQLFGLNAGWHHLTNVVLHIANVLLVFFVLLRLTGACWRSALVAALCAVHPLRVESVAWVAERKDLLAGLFWMLTIWMYVGYVRGHKAKKEYLLSLLMFLLAVMSKPTVVTLPFALLLLDYWPLERWPSTSIVSLLKEKIPFFVLSGFSSVITYIGQKQDGSVADVSKFAPGTHYGNVFLSYALYLRDLMWPRSLSVLYPYPLSIPGQTVLLSVAILATITALVFWRLRKSPYLVMGWLWFVGVLVPMSGIVASGGAARADRFTYIPAIGIFVMIVWGVSAAAMRYSVPRYVLASVSILVVSLLAAQSWVQVGYWSDSESLYKRSIAITGRNPILNFNLGAALDRKHRFQEAEVYYRQTLLEDPGFRNGYTKLGINLLEQGRHREGLDLLGRRVRLWPEDPEGIYNLAIGLEQMDRVPEAIQAFQKALLLGLPEPYVAPAHASLGQLWLVSGQNQAALKEIETALTTQPDLLEARINRALALATLGRRQESAEELARLRESNPNDQRIVRVWQYVQSQLKANAN